MEYVEQALLARVLVLGRTIDPLAAVVQSHGIPSFTELCPSRNMFQFKLSELEWTARTGSCTTESP